MLGAVTGDLVGSRFELHNHLSKDFTLLVPACHPTDDSYMTLAICQALLRVAPVAVNTAVDTAMATATNTAVDTDTAVDRAADRAAVVDWLQRREQLATVAIEEMQRWGRAYPHCGFGDAFWAWIQASEPKPYQSYGNGAAMRVSACAWVGQSLSEVKMLAQTVTQVSHDHVEGLKGAEATAAAIYWARTGKSQAEIARLVQEHYYSLDFTLDELRPFYGFDASCQGSVPQAIKAFLEANSFEDTLRNAVALGGDSDTIAAIAGSIAEAYFGIPESLREQSLGFLSPEQQALVLRFEQRYGKHIVPSEYV